MKKSSAKIILILLLAVLAVLIVGCDFSQSSTAQARAIRIENTPDTVYEVGDIYDRSGLLVIMEYMDGTPAKVIPDSYLMINVPDMTTAGKKTVEIVVMYAGNYFKTSYEITVLPAKQYNVTYVMYGGTNNISNKTVYTKNDSIMILAAPTKEGYDFIGWFDNPEFIGAPVTQINPDDKKDIVLYAKWAAETYSIVYHLNGGTNSGRNPSTYDCDCETISLIAAEKRGYSFTGWFDNSALTGNPVTAIAEGSVGDIELYAGWKAIDYTITYNINGGQLIAENPASYNIESDTITLNGAEKNGYVFIGWMDENNQPVNKIAKGSVGNLVLTAKYEIKVNTIVYNLNGGNADHGNPTEFTAEDNDIVLLPATRKGYEFAGWFDNNGNEVKVIKKGTTANITLSAKWTAIVYTITYNANGGENNAANPVSYTVETETITLLPAIREDYIFIGWKNGDAIINEIAKGTVGNLSLEAQWAQSTYSITYHLDGGENAAENPSSYTFNKEAILKAAAKSGYTFDGWYLNSEFTGEIVTVIAKGTFGNLDLYAKFTPITYTITYAANGGTHQNIASYTIETPAFTLLQAVKNGYKFVAWKDAEGNKVTVVAGGKTGNIELKAEFELIKYTIEYDYAGGKSVENPTEYTIETTSFVLNSPVKAGNTFLGWYDEKGNKFKQITKGTTGNIKLTAKWNVESYTISYELNGGTNNKDNPDSYRAGETITFKDAERTGYEFKGWFTDSNFGKQITSIAATDTGNKSLYAKWEVITYIIVYGATEEPESPLLRASGSGNPHSYTVETPTFVLEPVEKLGYEFIRWYNRDTGETVTEIRQGTTGDIYLKAEYRAIVYTITYELNGGVNNSSNPTTYTIETPTITLLAASKEGFRFDGWYEGTISVADIPLGSYGDKMLTAKWTKAFDYKIIYNLNGGRNNVENPDGFSADSSDIILKNPEKDGYKFLNWTDTNGDIITTIASGTTADVEVTANWEIIVYEIFYHVKNGTVPAENPTTYTIEDEDHELLPAERNGSEFKGWYKDEEYGSEPYSLIRNHSFGVLHLYAKWENDKYTIEYDLNDEVGMKAINDSANPTEYDVDTPDIELKPAVRTGYIFVNWTDSEGNAVEVIEQGSIGDITLKANWELKVYIITYEPKGGTYPETNPTEYTIESPDLIIAPAVREGAEFVTWYLIDDGVELDYNVVPNGSHGDITLYARWNTTEFTIEYVLNGGTNHPDNPASYNVDDEDIVLEDASRDGYEFGGWYLDPEFNDAITTILVTTADDIIIYAKWNAVSYEIEYECNGGTNHPDNPLTYTVEDAGNEILPAIRNGYEFLGWYEKADFTGIVVDEIPSDWIGNKKLYAKWQEATYIITYEVGNGTNHPDNPLTYTITTPTTPLKPASMDGATFAGWYFYPDYSGEAQTEILYGSFGDVTYYAKWDYIEYPITYVLNGGVNAENPTSYTVEEEVEILDATREGYTFGGWYEKADFSGDIITKLPSGNLGAKTLYAKWVAITYKIEYIVEDYEIMPEEYNTEYTVESEFILPVPVYNGYRFMGWQVVEHDTMADTIIFDIEKGTTGDMKLDPVWEEETYTIVYDLRGGVNDPSNPETYTITTPDFEFMPATREGYVFLGWYSKNNPEFGEVTGVKQGSFGTISIYALWEGAEVVINYELNGGTNNEGNPDTAKVGDTVVLLDPTYNGAEFLGWYTTPEFDEESKVTKITIETEQDIIVYAKWNILQYTIEYRNIDDESAGNPTTYNVNTPTFTLRNAVKDGYDFLGWYKEADFSGEKIEKIEQGTTGDLILYAKWEIHVYEITYHDDKGGVNDPRNKSSYTIETPEFEIYAPTHEGDYIFLGWNLKETFDGDIMTKVEKGHFGDIHLYAEWELKTYTITYHLNGGINAEENITEYDIETSFEFLNANRNGAHFLGWYLSPDFNAESKIEKIEEGTTGELQLYAKWDPIVYRITLYDGEEAVETMNYTVDSPDIIFRTLADKDGIAFYGWNDKHDFTGNYITGIRHNTTYGDINLYAKWGAPIETSSITNIFDSISIMSQQNRNNFYNSFIMRNL